MDQLKKSDLFNAPRPKPVRVDLPDLGKVAYVRILSAAEVEEAQAAVYGLGDDGEPTLDLRGQRGRLLSLAVCDESGVRVFGDDDADEIGRLPSLVVEPLFDAIQAANGMTKGAKEKARKNSSPAPA